MNHSADAGGGLDLSLALGAQIRDREGEHARALLAAKTKAKQAAEEMLKLRESHAAAVESLHAAHSAALQQQKKALEQALTVRSGLTHSMQSSHKALQLQTRRQKMTAAGRYPKGGIHAMRRSHTCMHCPAWVCDFGTLGRLCQVSKCG